MDLKSTVDIVIVNWNGGDQLAQCIASVRAYRGDHVARCIVVDNGSTDGSLAFLDGADDIMVIRTGQNLGFGRACNIGAERCDSPLLLFLNPDARLMEHSLDVPLTYLSGDGHERVGIVGVQLVDEDGSVQRTCARAPNAAQLLAKSIGLAAFVPQWDYHMKTWDHATTRPVDHVMGAFFLMRRGLFDRLEGFDECFFVYLEDLDLSYRASLASYRTMYLTEGQAYHKGGGVSEQVKAHRLFYSLRSRMQYAFKHFSWLAALSVSFATLIIEPLSRLVLLTVQRRFGEIGDLACGYRMLWHWVLTSKRGVR